jgi:pimeloyl-ACP methyl ester carboxylesterase
VIEVPDLGDTVGQVVLLIDEDGIITWNFPVDQMGRLETPNVRGAGNSKKFIIRRNVAPTSPAAAAQKRGLLQILGRKILKILVYKVTDPVLGAISEAFARKWEEKKRTYAVRNFTPGNYLQPEIPPLSSGEWGKIGEGHSLLFIHGTTSSAHTGFGNFPQSTLNELYQNYQTRVFAFNHFTLSEDPEQNVNWFIRQIPPGITLDTDIICHSRGGLVARTLAGGLTGNPFPQVKVRKIVFAGTPNNGTVLANANHITDFVDRYTTILNLAPPGPVSVVADILEGIITVVKVIAHAGLNGLPGLTAMNPGGNFITRLNAPGKPPDTQYFALTADYEPKGGLKDFIKNKIQDELVDRAFGNVKNDLLVPTEGVYKGFNAAGFPITEKNVLSFPPSQGVAHSYYFIQPETPVKLKEWLLPVH